MIITAKTVRWYTKKSQPIYTNNAKSDNYNTRDNNDLTPSLPYWRVISSCASW